MGEPEKPVVSRPAATRSCRRATECGAATLMAVLFLLIVIAFAVLVATRMSGSDITDTSLAQSGVSALLLAESGVERAAARYASGATACASLAVDGPYTLGQGSFTVNAVYSTDFSGANLPPGECRVQVQGTVGMVQRTVQAILQKPASTGFIVGNGGVALECGGSTCTATKTNTTDDLVGVSCPTVSDCIAVGANGTVIQWNGSAWNPIPTGYGNLRFTAVACEPGNGNDCFVSGAYLWGGFLEIPIILQWNGNAWNIPSIGQQFGSLFTDIACAGTGASTACYATIAGRYFAANQYWVGNGGGGSMQNSNASNSLSMVSCALATNCWATESYAGHHGDRGGNAWYFDALGPAGGSETSISANGNNSASSAAPISCDATNDCWAAEPLNGNHSTFAYWSGTQWNAVPTTVKETLYGMDCLSSNDCWAVGANGTVLLGSGVGAARTWAAVTSGTIAQLNAVSFPAGAGGGGSTVVIQWHEVES